MTDLEIIEVVNRGVRVGASFCVNEEKMSKIAGTTREEWAREAEMELEICKVKLLSEIAIRLGRISEKIEGA